MTSGAKRMVFTDREKEILINLVSTDIRILEDKKNDAKAIATKQQAWKKLSEKFNSHCDVRPCTFQQLKKCWMNIKSR